MATKIDGLEVVKRDSKRGSAEYTYKGVRISKYTQERGYKGRLRGSYVRAGVKFTFHIDHYRADAYVKMSYSTVKNYTLKDTVEEINCWLAKNDMAVENGKIINGVTDRAIIKAEKVNA